EEKERGMTIDLGFAWAELPSGRQIGIVDVPGHERFVKNMVAGVGGIDAVIFVIAADDGWMPQSEEHFQIINLLGIKTGLIALTKKDLVDEEYLGLQTDAIRERLRDSFLEDCPIIPVSNNSGEGVSDILKALDGLLTDEMQRPDLGAARLFIDRRFTIQGMGTVVTGTLLEGKFTLDQQVEIEPSGIKSRIRNLQTHKHKLNEAFPGSRVAINLAGIEKSAIDRGEAVCLPGTVTPTQQIAAELSLLAGAKLSLKSGFEVSFLLGTADVFGRVYFIDTEAIKPGQQGFVKIKLNSPVAAKLGDRFIIRRISPQDTIGGGIVLDTEILSGNKNKALQHDILEKRSKFAPESIILTELEKNIRVPLSKLYQNIPFRRQEMESALRALSERGDILVFSDNVLSRKSLEKFAAPAIAILESDHQIRPWSDGIEPGAIAKKLKLSPEQLPAVVDYLVSTGKVTHEKGYLKLTSHEAQLNPDQLRMQGRLNARLSASPLAAPTRKEFIDEEPKYEVVINFLRDKGEIIELKGGILFTRRDFDEIIRSLTEYLKKAGQATASDIKTHLKTSRKYIIPILEKLDQMEITIRDGDYRRLAK
ncbi:MAG TPA: selenocysteine-specific translation elongation factor, partial [candidate division Zixibacteria bacterium]|nr:selenocysteine-specific translation elongation factor [candidate division Zixibacteria bacterium]